MINKINSIQKVQLLYVGHAAGLHHLLFKHDNATSTELHLILESTFKSLGFTDIKSKHYTIDKISTTVERIRPYFRVTFFAEKPAAHLTDFSHADTLEVYFKSYSYNWEPYSRTNVDFLKELK